LLLLDDSIGQFDRRLGTTVSGDRPTGGKVGIFPDLLRGAVDVKLRPHDLRRHAAAHASRSGVPVEIVSKVILRAIRWIDNLYS